MRLDLRLPPGWTSEQGTHALVLRAPRPELVVHVAPLRARTSVHLPSLLELERPPLSRSELKQTLKLSTETGWPMHLVTISVLDARGPVETRLAAIYEILHWTGFAIAIAKDPEVYEAHREGLVELFTSARPDLRTDEPVCVRELWEMRDG